MTTHDYMRAIWASSVFGRLNATERAVLWAYIVHADADGLAWPSALTIAQQLGQAEDSHVRRARRSLIDVHGLLAEANRPNGRPAFRLIVPAQEDARPVPNRHGSEDTGDGQNSPVRKSPVPNRPVRNPPSRPVRNPHAEVIQEPEDSFPSETTADAAAAAGRPAVEPRQGGERVHAKPATLPARRKPDRKLSDEHNAIREAFIAWWCDEAYPQAFEGIPYEFSGEGPRNGQAVKRLLEFTRYDLEHAKRIALFYLRSDPILGAPNLRPLFGITIKFQFWVQSERGARSMPYANHGNRYGHGNYKPSAATVRRDYEQPKRQLPSLKPAVGSGPAAGPEPDRRAG